jgi:hypothetical protein
MIDKISKDQEQKLVDSVVDAIKLSNDGMHPNEAIAKVASDQGFNQDFIKRMAEAFNVSKSLKHLKSAKGDDRAAEFAIADPGVVIAELYPEAVVAPEEVKASSWEPAGSNMSDERFFDLESTPVLSEPREKTATHDGPTVDMMINRAYTELNHLERTAGVAKQAMAEAKDTLVQSIAKFASYFRQLSPEPFEKVESAALEHWGEGARSLMTAVYNMSKRAAFGDKRAEAGAKVKYGDRRPYELLAQAVDARDTYAEAAVKYAGAKRAYVEYKDKLDLRSRLVTKIAEGGIDLSIPGLMSPFQSLMELPTPEMSQSMVDETKAELLSPEYMAERRSIGTQLTLRDIMKNDPVIRSANPESVLSAYNELSRTAPSITSSPLALRAYLRKSIEAETMDPIEIAALIKMDKQLRSDTIQPEK